MSSWSRRTVLRAGAGTLGTILSGCSSELPLDGRERTRLQRVKLWNCSSTPHTFHVLVEVEGELVYWASHALEGGDCESVVIADAVLERPRRWTLRARLDARHRWAEATPAADPELAACQNLLVTYEPKNDGIQFYPDDCS